MYVCVWVGGVWSRDRLMSTFVGCLSIGLELPNWMRATS